MSVLTWLERRLGRFAIPNLTLLIIVIQVVLYLGSMQNPQVLSRLLLDSAKIREGDYLRLISFLVMPPGMGPVWAFFFWSLFYMMGTALEIFWGTFRYNVFLLIGYLATLAVVLPFPNGIGTNWFLQGTVFLAFAWLNPDFILNIFFILPVRIKWLALLTWIGFALTLVSGSWPARLTVIASTLNFLIFFAGDLWQWVRTGQRKVVRQAKRITEKPAPFFHRCVTCGITDKSHPEMDFRYCSRCEGEACYCSEHLRDHTHIVKAS